MSRMIRGIGGVGAASRRTLQAALLVATAGLAGCDSLLEVDLPGTFPQAQLRTPANAPLLRNSVQSQFECFFANYVGGRAMWVGEGVVGSQRAGRHFWMTRQVQPIENRGGGACEAAAQGEQWGSLFTHYQAWGLARDVSGWLGEWTDAEVPGRVGLLAATRSYGAYALMLFAESFCAGAVLEENGPLVKPTDVMRQAETWWTQALEAATASNNAQFRNLALVGRARTRLWLGKLAEAATDAEQVPAGFRFDATYAAHPQRENYVWTEFNRDNHNSVHQPLTRIRLDVDGVPDPRVAIVNRNTRTIDGRTPAWAPAKYTSVASPIRMASWAEAQLIIAEARLGQVAVDRINALRQGHNLPLYTPVNVADQNEILDQVIEERSRELYLEGQRINDMLRHFDRASVRSKWPEGATNDGDPIFNNYCFWFPEREVDANPNVSSADIPNTMMPSVMRR